jgi:hypothetical protein
MSTVHPTLKRKYQVFISSTFTDLVEERQEAALGVVRAGHFPLNLEYSGPDPATKLEVIKNSIADCQYYVIILGHRYGSVGGGQNKRRAKSYVELELDDAESKHLKILAFVMDEKKVRELRNHLRRPKDLEEIQNEEKYWRLYRRLTANVEGLFSKPFKKPEDIYIDLLVYFSKDHDDVKGYTPEPMAEEDANILRVSASNDIVKETIQRLGQFKFVDPRLSIAKEKKLALAKAFQQLHGEHIGNQWRKVFIESGSTLAYVAKELAPRLLKMGVRPERRIITNNALAYLYLWLCAGVLCHPEPEGPPDNKYGGMFGALTGRDRSPDYRQPALEYYDPEAVELIEQMSIDVFGEPEDNTRSILLGTASALQLSNDVKTEGGAVKPKGLSTCRGFHGGSYENRLFKRCMYLSKIPAYIFMHDDKINWPVNPGFCHFLCDSGYPWNNYIEDYPLSLWIACETDTLVKVLREARNGLTAGDWKFATYREAMPTPIVMATNNAFRKACNAIGVKPFEAQCTETQRLGKAIK